MSRPRTPPPPTWEQRLASFIHSIWPVLRNVGTTLLGAYILYDQVVVEETAQILLIVLAGAFLNVPVVHLLQGILKNRIEEE